MSTRREQIISAVVAALGPLVSSNVVTGVYRSRAKAFARKASPAILVEPQSDNPAQQTMPKIDWALTVRVVVVVHSDEPDLVADPILEALHEAVMTDTTLDGLVVDRFPSGVNYEIEAGDKPVGLISCGYQFAYQTALNNLTTTI